METTGAGAAKTSLENSVGAPQPGQKAGVDGAPAGRAPVNTDVEGMGKALQNWKGYGASAEKKAAKPAAKEKLAPSADPKAGGPETGSE